MKLVAVLFALLVAAQAAYVFEFSEDCKHFQCSQTFHPNCIKGIYYESTCASHTGCFCSDEVDYQLALTDIVDKYDELADLDFTDYAGMGTFEDTTEACENRAVQDSLLLQLGTNAVCYDGEFVYCADADVCNGECTKAQDLVNNCDEPMGQLYGCAESENGPVLGLCASQQEIQCARQCAMQACGYKDSCGPCLGTCENEWEYCSPETFTCVPRTETYVLFYIKAFQWSSSKRSADQRSMQLPAYFENAIISDFTLAMNIPTKSVIIIDEQYYVSEQSHVFGVLLQASYDLVPAGVDLVERYDDAVTNEYSMFFHGAVTRNVQTSSDIFITDLPNFPSSLIVSEPSSGDSSYIYSPSVPQSNLPVYSSSEGGGSNHLLYLLFLLFILLIIVLVIAIIVALFLRVKVVIKGDEGAVVRQ